MNQQELINKVIENLSSEVGNLTKDVIILKTQLEMALEDNGKLRQQLEQAENPVVDFNPEA